MIEILNGIKETINYGSSSSLRLFHNIEYENYPPHWHVGIEIIMPLSSTYDVTVGDTAYHLETGDIIFINSGEIHSLQAPPTGERIVLQFDLALLYSLGELDTTIFMLPPAVVISQKHSGPMLYKNISELMYKIIEEYDSSKILKGPSVYSYLIQIYVRLCRENVYENENFQNTTSAKQHEYIEKFLQTCNYINQHYNENLTLEKIADIAGFSKFHFSRLFKQFTNMTFNEYLNQHRIKKAEELLMDDHLSVMDVAMASGFSSLSNFNRAFRLCNNCSPSEYRKKRSAKSSVAFKEEMDNFV